MTPKIMDVLSRELSTLEDSIRSLNEKKHHLENQIEEISNNAKAIREFLSTYEPQTTATAKPKPTNGHGHSRFAYGPSAETLEFLKGVYPNFVSAKLIKDNLTQSGMKLSGDLLVRLRKKGAIEYKPNPEATGYLYRIVMPDTRLDNQK